MSGAYDYIVIGAGSAGCVVVRRLIDAGKRVLLLEAGPSDDTMFVKMPATFIRVIGSKRSWLYKTEPQAHAKNRCMYVPARADVGRQQFAQCDGLYPWYSAGLRRLALRGLVVE